MNNILDTSDSNSIELCRICLEEDEIENLIYPCKCSGTNKYVHKRCLNEWRASSDNRDNFDRCEICHYKYLCKTVTSEGNFDKICRYITDIPLLFYTLNYVTIISIYYLLIFIDSKSKLMNMFNNDNIYIGISSLTVLLFQICTVIYWFIKIKNKYLYCNLYVRNKSFIIWGILFIFFSLFFDWILTIFIAQIICLNLYQKHFVINDNLNKLEYLELENYDENQDDTLPILENV